MEPQKRSSTDSGVSANPQGFKTMDIQTRPQPPPHLAQSFPQASYYNNMIMNIANVIISFYQNESNKKFYKNEVLLIRMSQLPAYNDILRVKASFPRCATVNNEKLSFERLKQAEFFVLRSTCDDDIHKAIKYGLWTSTNYTNHILNNRFKECSRHNIPLFLIFTFSNQRCKFRTVLWNC